MSYSTEVLESLLDAAVVLGGAAGAAALVHTCGWTFLGAEALTIVGTGAVSIPVTGTVVVCTAAGLVLGLFVVAGIKYFFLPNDNVCVQSHSLSASFFLHLHFSSLLTQFTGKEASCDHGQCIQPERKTRIGQQQQDHRGAPCECGRQWLLPKYERN
jgi:hypothetical protein